MLDQDVDFCRRPDPELIPPTGDDEPALVTAPGAAARDAFDAIRNADAEGLRVAAPRAISAWLDGVKSGYGEKYAAVFEDLGVDDEEDVHNLRDDLARDLRAALERAGAKRGHLNNIESAVIAKRVMNAPRHLALAPPTPTGPQPSGALGALGREALKLADEKDAAPKPTLGQVPRRRRLLAQDDSYTTAFVSSDDESTPTAMVLPEVGAALADASLLYEQVFDEPTVGDAALQLMDLSNEPAVETSSTAAPAAPSAVAALTPPRRRGKSSRFTGVTWDISNGNWRAQIGVKMKKIRLGAFDDEEDAARAYDAAVVKYRNEPTVNFPGEVPLASTMAALPPGPTPPPPPVAPFVDGPRVRSKPRDRNWGPDGPPQKRAKKRPPPVVAQRESSKKSCEHACGRRHKFSCPLAYARRTTKEKKAAATKTSKATARVAARDAGLANSVEVALADDRWDVCQKWTFAHAAAPYPSAEEKAVLSKKTERPPGRVNHWFSNKRKRKYLKLCDGSLAPRDAFEAQLYRLIPKAIALAHKQAAHQKKQAAIAAAKEKVNCVKQTTSVDASAPVAIPAEAPAAANPRPRKRAKKAGPASQAMSVEEIRHELLNKFGDKKEALQTVSGEWRASSELAKRLVRHHAFAVVAKVDLTTPHVTEIRAAFQREQATDTIAAGADRESPPRAGGGPGPPAAVPQEPLNAPPEAPAPAPAARPAAGWTPLHKLLDLFADSDDDKEDA